MSPHIDRTQFPKPGVLCGAVYLERPIHPTAETVSTTNSATTEIIGSCFGCGAVMLQNPHVGGTSEFNYAQ